MSTAFSPRVTAWPAEEDEEGCAVTGVKPLPVPVELGKDPIAEEGEKEGERETEEGEEESVAEEVLVGRILHVLWPLERCCCCCCGL